MKKVLFIIVLFLLHEGIIFAGTSTVPFTKEASSNFNLKKELSGKVISWLNNKNTSESKECDRLAELAIKQDGSVDTYFAAAQIFNILGNPQKAIQTLEEVIKKYPTIKDRGSNLPVIVSGYFRIGAIARQANDIEKAKKAYKGALSNMSLISNNEIYVAICNMYLVEIELNLSKNVNNAKPELELILKSPKAKNELINIMQSWAKYQLIKSTKDKTEAQQIDINSNNLTDNSIYFAALLTKLNGVGEIPFLFYNAGRANIDNYIIIKEIARKDIVCIDRSVSNLLIGYEYTRRAKHIDAEQYFKDLFEEDGFFSPVGGIYLAHCQAKQEKVKDAERTLENVKIKYPGYSNTVDSIRDAILKKN